MNSRADIYGTVKCSHCGKGLRAFKTKNDWSQRKLHKECWKLIQFMKEMKEQYKNEVIQQQHDKNWELLKLEHEHTLREIKELREKNQRLNNSVEFYKSFTNL